jgi:hypothetical protein
MGMINGLRAMNALTAGTMSGAQLTTYLASGINYGSFTQLLNLKGQANILVNSSSAMTAIVASSTASVAISNTPLCNNAVLGGSYSVGAYLDRLAIVDGASTNATLAAQTTMANVSGSSTAIAAAWASNTATKAIMSSANAKLEVYKSDVALAALQAAPTQVQTLITNKIATLIVNTWPGAAINLIPNGTKIIILRRYYSAADYDYFNWARDSYTSGTGNGPAAGSGVRTLYASGSAAVGCTSGTYTSNSLAPANDATGNFVCAANGLRKDSSATGGLSYIYYITV